MPARAAGRGRRARERALAVVERFGYLQLDTVSIAGARSHSLVLLSRLDGIDPTVGEELLRPGEPLFEYWGHEASWIPLELYPLFEFRRRDFASHPWWGDLIAAHPEIADRIRCRLRDEGPLRSVDLEGRGGRGFWDLKIAKKVATALWSSGELAIRERRRFQRTFDLTERVIPDELRARPWPEEPSLEALLLRALDGHGWAPTRTLAATWRLRGKASAVRAALARLVERGAIVPCRLDARDGAVAGWIQPCDLELLDRLDRLRPRRDRGVLLSPFDPLLWDRRRVARLFDFEQVLEIFKPAAARKYGYYCLPVLAGERLVARVDLKADRRAGRLQVLSTRYESTGTERSEDPAATAAVESALRRHAEALGFELDR